MWLPYQGTAEKRRSAARPGACGKPGCILGAGGDGEERFDVRGNGRSLVSGNLEPVEIPPGKRRSVQERLPEILRGVDRRECLPKGIFGP